MIKQIILKTSPNLSILVELNHISEGLDMSSPAVQFLLQASSERKKKAYNIRKVLLEVKLFLKSNNKVEHTYT
jgi:hypothetical protein